MHCMCTDAGDTVRVGDVIERDLGTGCRAIVSTGLYLRSATPRCIACYRPRYVRPMAKVVIVVVDIVEFPIRDDLSMRSIDASGDLDVSCSRAAGRSRHALVSEETVVIVYSSVCDANDLACAGDAMVPYLSAFPHRNVSRS
jgi:hypothetical protein